LRIAIVIVVALLFTLPATCIADQAARGPDIQKLLAEGRKKVERFFSKRYLKPFDVEVCPNRAAFDAYMRNRWNLPETEMWMVAMGVADKLLILSPQVWKTEAVEHNPENSMHVRAIIVHELVHVYHGQFSPKPDFDGMDDLGWFVEGLATYVSEQLEREHPNDAREAISMGKVPANLKDAWSGRYRYGVCGSLVKYVDRKYGRKMLTRLMTVTTPKTALELLGATEDQFLADWRKYVLSGK
jgi:hypothetical protein